MRGMNRLLVIAALGACTYDTTERSIWTIETRSAECPQPADAEDSLVAAWGTVGNRIDGNACRFTDLVAVEPDGMRTDDGCCYSTSCSVELSPHDELALFDATCIGLLRCASINLEVFTREKVEADLAATGLPCALTDAPSPSDVSATVCTYWVTASYECSSEPG